MWKAADSAPANYVPVLETGLLFWKNRLEFSPVDYFKQYADNNILKKIAEKTNKRIPSESGTIAKVTGQKVKQFLCCSMLRGVISYPRIRFYRKNLAVSSVAHTMPQYSFFLLRSNLCCQLEDDVSDDDKKWWSLWKVVPLFEVLRKDCIGLEWLSCFCVDEKIIPFSRR